MYYGGEILETVVDDRNHLACKLMETRHYNANVKVTVMQKEFGFDRNTMKKWGLALKGGSFMNSRVC